MECGRLDSVRWYFELHGKGILRAETVCPFWSARMRKLRTQPPVAPRTAMVCLGWALVDIVILLTKFLNMFEELRCFESDIVVMRVEEVLEM